MTSPAPRRSSRLRGVTPQYEEPKEQSIAPSLESVPEQEDPAAPETTMPGEFPSTDFDFHHSLSLSAEAQAMMDEVRKKAAKVMETMRAEEAEEASRNGGSNTPLSGRKYAQPKGRFSDAHDAHFGKMASIADHPSAFRTSTSKEVLKITPEEEEKPQSAAKRRRVTEQSHIPVTMHTPTKRPSVTSTTQSSLARTNSTRSISKIPSTPSLKRPAKTPTSGIKTDGNLKFRNAIRKISTPVKSILRRPQIRFSEDPAKVAAGTHLSPPKFDLAPESTTEHMERSPKRVEFSDIPDEVFSTRAGSSNNLRGHDITKRVASTATKVASGVTYPDLRNASASTGINSVEYPTIEVNPPRPTAGNFTFRADQTISFAPRASPAHSASKLRTPTIRKVASQSFEDLSTPVPPIRLSTPKTAPQPAYIAHGLTNKKRKHSHGYDTGGLDIVVKEPVDQSPSCGAGKVAAKVFTPTKSPLSKTAVSERKMKTPVSVRVARFAGFKSGPTAPKSETKKSPAAYIAHGLSNKKRKHSETYDTAGLDIVVPSTEDEDKENTPSRHDKATPAKRARLTLPTASTVKKASNTSSKITKPKPPSSTSRLSALRTPLTKAQPKSPARSTGSQNRTALSLARLNALATPKKR